jgi:hypothetical protein
VATIEFKLEESDAAANGSVAGDEETAAKEEPEMKETYKTYPGINDIKLFWPSGAPLHSRVGSWPYPQT